MRAALRWWAAGVVHPVEVMRSLSNERALRIGATAAVTRFAIQDIAETLPLALLRKRPFTPPKLSIAPERYYRAQLAFQPPFGIGAWLLMGLTAQTILRLTGHRRDARRVLDVLGAGMLIPMPPLWIGDLALIATDRYRRPGLSYTHIPVQMWETSLFVMGLHEALDVPWGPALLAGASASVTYILGASAVLR